MATLSLAVFSGLRFIKNHLKSSAPCARKLSFFDGSFKQHCADSTSCARALSRLSVASVAKRHRASSTSCARALSLLGVFVITAVSAVTMLLPANTAEAATSNQLNFQGRLLTSAGALVPDGNYHIEFKLYSSASAGASAQGVCVGGLTDDCLWTETRSTGDLVSIQNGYYSVYLGDVTAFPDIDWSQDLYLTMNIGGDGGAASWDGEMSPRFKLTAVPYAFRAANVASSDADSADSDDVNITSGDTTTSGNSGDIVIDTGSAAGTTGAITLGATQASALTIGNGSATTTLQGLVSLTGTGTALTVTNNVQVDGNTTLGSDTSDTLTVEANATFNGSLTVSTGDQFTNAGSTLLTAKAIANDVDGGVLGATAANTVDVATTLNVSQGTAGQSFTLATPTDSATAGRIVYVNAVGAASFTLEGQSLAAGDTAAFIWDGSGWNPLTNSAAGGVTSVGAFSATPIVNGGSVAGSVLTLGVADDTNVGLLSTTTQTIGGAKTFNNLITGIAGLTISGGDVNLNASSNFNTSINTGGSTGTTTIGGGSNTLVIDSTAFDVSSLGAVSGVTTLNLSGAITGATTTDTINGLIINAGSLSGITGYSQASGNFAIAGSGTFSTGTGTVTLNGDTTVSGSNTLSVGTGLTSLGGALTTTGLTTLNGGLTVEAGDTFTFNGQGFTNFLTGGLTNASGVLTVDSTTATGFFRNGGNSFVGAATLGTNNGNTLAFRTNSATRFTLSAAASTLTGSGATVLAGGSTLGLTSAAGSALSVTSGTTGALNLDTGTTGTINLGAGTGAKTINLGTGGTGVKTINVGGTAANVIGIGNTQTGGSISVGAALTTGTINIGGTGAQTGAINLGNGTGAQTINLAAGAGVKTTVLGSNTGASTTTVRSGTGNLALQSAGTINLTGTASNGALNAIASIGGTVASTGADQMSGLLVNPNITLSTSSAVQLGGGLFAPTTSTNNLDVSGAALIGVAAQPIYAGTGTLWNLIGSGFQYNNANTGTVNNALGIAVEDGLNPFGTVTTGFGVSVSDQTAASNNINLYLGATGSGVTFPTGDYSIYSESSYANFLQGALTVDNSITTGDSDTAGLLRVSDGSSNFVTINVQALAGDYTISIPTISANDTFCLATAANCSADSTTITVAADDSSAAEKAGADYVADGTSDETEINAALTAATGGKVILLSGSFVIDGSISVPNDTHLEGQGDGTLITLDSDVDGVDAIVNTDQTGSGTGVILSDFKLDGDKATNANSHDGISFGRTNNSTIRNVTVTDFDDNGIFMNWSYYNTITDVRSTSNNISGFRLLSIGEGNVVSNSVFSSNSQYGLSINDGSRNTVTNIVANSNGIAGINIVSSNAYGNTVTTSTANNNTRDGVRISGINNKVSDGTFNNNSENGILFFDFGVNNVADGNIVTNNADAGIYAIGNGVTSPVITNNYLNRNGGSADNYAIRSTIDDTIITNNVIDDDSCTTTCIAIDVTGDNVTLSGNQLRNGTINNTGTGTAYEGQSDSNSNYLIQPASGNVLLGDDNYLNFGGVTGGATGYGFRDVSGDIQLKVEDGCWFSLNGGSCSVTTTPVIEGSTSTAEATSTSTVLTVPSETTEGDLLVATVFTHDFGSTPPTPATPAGWTQQLISTTTGGGFNSKVTVFTRTASGETPGTTTYSFAHTNRESSGSMLVISGADTSDPIDVSALANDTGSNPHTLPAVTTTVTNTLGIGAVSSNDDYSPNPGTITNWTSVVNAGESEVYQRDFDAIATYSAESDASGETHASFTAAINPDPSGTPYGNANRRLNNLSNVAINATLGVDTDNAYDLGSSTAGFRNLYLASDAIIGGDLTVNGESTFNDAVSIIGSDDQSQLIVQANATQTSPLIVARASDGTTELFRIDTGPDTGSLFTGFQSGAAVTSGTSNTGYGFSALQAVSTGDQNTAFGSAALTANIGGGSNAAFGLGALSSSTSGDFSTAIGTSALRNVLGAGYNTALGSGAGLGAVGSTSIGNTFIGVNSGQNNLTANDNTFIGNSSGQNITTGDANVILGAIPFGSYALTEGSNNIFLGGAGSNVTTGSGNIFIGGTSLTASGVAAANELNIGGVLQGNTSTGSALFQNASNSTSGFRINDAGSNAILEADTTNFLLKVAPTQFLSSGTTQDFAADGSITGVDSFSTIAVNATATDVDVTLPAPAAGGQVVGRVIYVTAVNGSEDFTLTLAGTSIDISMKQNSTATLIWNGTGWTAAGASSSTDLQSAYNNTLSSAGAAELVLNASGGAADGLTVRNNAVSPIIGALLEVQTSIGSNLFSVNNNAVEYATNGGAETWGASPSTFPANTWLAGPSGGTVDRYDSSAGSFDADNIATGQGSVRVVTTATTNHGARNRLSTALTDNLTYTVSYAVKGATNFSTLETVFSPDGTNTGTVTCTTGDTVTSSYWTRVICTFVAPSSGITADNSIFIRQTDATARTFYIDNLSVNVNAAATYAADGSVDDAGAFATNWTGFGAGTTVTRDTSLIYDTSASARVNTPNNADRGIRNNLAVTPAIDSQYLVTLYAQAGGGAINDVTVRYSRDGGTNFIACQDYNTQAITTGQWTKITCLFKTDGTTPTDADLIITQATAPGGGRTIYVDALEIVLNDNNSNNVQIGGANRGGPVTLFTLDRASSAPIGANNEAYLGSMYYDTTSGRIQCYEADGWGACGSAPDNIVNLNPEYAGSVLNGTGVGTMTADVCANETGVLIVNASFCDTGEARNFYNWTSPQGTAQEYSIYITYQLPSTFKAFASDDTVQLTARRDGSNAEVSYEMFRSEGGTITACGSETTVTTADDTWQTVGINGNESTGCGFTTASAEAFVIFKLNLTAESNANAYVSTLSFTTTGR